MDYSPIILKNKGVPCEFAKTHNPSGSEDGWERVLDDEGNIIKEVLNVKFTNNSVSEIEMHFGGLEQWQEALEKYPINTIRQSLAFCLKRHVYDIGEAMLDGEAVMYSNVIGASWSIANGVDPTVASKMLQQSIGLANEQKRLLNDQLTSTMAAATLPGTNGSDSGPKRASRSKNSGN